jgi:hypothetical protein
VLCFINFRIPIKDHTVCWNQPIKVLSQKVISKKRLLGPCELKLEVFQELGGKQASSIGDLTINLSEYVDSQSTTDRFLLNHSKFNSTLKVCSQNKVGDAGEPSFMCYIVIQICVTCFFCDSWQFGYIRNQILD